MINPSVEQARYYSNHAFRVGDVVEIIDKEQDCYLTMGKRYVVAEADAYMHEGVKIIRDDGSPFWLSSNQFQLIFEAEPILLEEGDWLTLLRDIEIAYDDYAFFPNGDYVIQCMDVEDGAFLVELDNGHGREEYFSIIEFIDTQTGKLQMPACQRRQYDEYLKCLAQQRELVESRTAGLSVTTRDVIFNLGDN